MHLLNANPDKLHYTQLYRQLDKLHFPLNWSGSIGALGCWKLRVDTEAPGRL